MRIDTDRKVGRLDGLLREAQSKSEEYAKLFSDSVSVVYALERRNIEVAAGHLGAD